MYHVTDPSHGKCVENYWRHSWLADCLRKLVSGCGGAWSMKWQDTHWADGKTFLQFELLNFTSSLLVLGGEPGKASQVPGLRYPMGGKNVSPHVSNDAARGKGSLNGGSCNPQPSMWVMSNDLEPWRTEFGWSVENHATVKQNTETMKLHEVRKCGIQNKVNDDHGGLWIMVIGNKCLQTYGRLAPR